MIVSVWKPISVRSKTSHYELVNNESLLSKKGTTGYKVIWVCDDINCRTPKKLHSIQAFHLRKDKMSYETQICRSCQCSGIGNGRYGDRRKWSDFHDQESLNDLKLKYSEKWRGDRNPSKIDVVKRKKNQVIIDTKYLNELCMMFNFNLIEIFKIDGKHSEFLVKCRNGHHSKKRYSSFSKKNKKWRCSHCFYDSIGHSSIGEDTLEFIRYRNKVRSLTAKNYRKYREVINPNEYNLSRTEYHLDHKYSIYEGYKNNVDVRVISSKENLEVIHSHENLKKQTNCSITLDELLLKTKYLY